MDQFLKILLYIFAYGFFYSIALFVVIRYVKTIRHSRVSSLTRLTNFAFVLFAFLFPYFQTGSLLNSYLIVTIPIAIIIAVYPFALGLREDGITIFRIINTPKTLLNVVGKFIAYEDTQNWTLIEEEKYIKVRFLVKHSSEDYKKEVLFEREQKREIVELLESKGLTIRLIDNDFL